jgi:predicted RND superfamily exporter protein
VATIAIIVIGVGLGMIIIGTIISVVDWSRKGKVHPGEQTKTLGLADTITALQKLMLALAKHPVGIRLIVLGIVLVLVGGVLGGVAGITS